MIRLAFFVIFISLTTVLNAQSKLKPSFSTFTDLRDKKNYRTVTIGNQTWMGLNLNYKIAGSWCYNDSNDLCKTYGRLYSLEAASKACPDGWHLPTADEWQKLIKNIGGSAVAGKLLKESGFDHWNESDQKASNASGFKALPAGYRDALTNSFIKLGEEAVFWSSTKITGNNNYGWSFFLHYNSNRAFIENITLSDPKNGYSVRCLKNTTPAL